MIDISSFLSFYTISLSPRQVYDCCLGTYSSMFGKGNIPDLNIISFFGFN